MQKEKDYTMVQCNVEMDIKQIKNENMIIIMAEYINKLKNIQTLIDANQNDKN